MQAHSATTENTALVAIDFHGDQLLTCSQSGEPYVAMRRVVDNIGLNWPGQHAKLVDSADKFACMDIHTHDTLGRPTVMLGIPVAKLPLWLAAINPNKIPDPVKRAKIELYQAESAIALHDYWTKGVAVRGDMDGVVTSFDDAAMKVMIGANKRSVRKALAEMMPVMLADAVRDLLPSLVNEQLLLGDRKVVQGVSALEVADMAGYGRGNRPRGLSQFITRKLWAYHIARKHFPERSPHGAGKVWVYNESLVRRWLMEGGQIEIDHYAAKRKGQGSLRLVQI